jgi:hypothetical protein
LPDAGSRHRISPGDPGVFGDAGGQAGFNDLIAVNRNRDDLLFARLAEDCGGCP